MSEHGFPTMPSTGRVVRVGSLLLLLFMPPVVQAVPALETVVVYAGRDDRRLSQVSSMTSIVSIERASLFAPEHPSQVLQAAAGSWVSRGSGQEHLTAIRSPVLTGAGACGAFWMAQDGIPLRADGFCNANQLFDAHIDAADSIQVLKGPHAAQLGGNSLYGGINVNLPTADTVTGRIAFNGSMEGYRKLHIQNQLSGREHAAAVFATAVEDDGIRSQSGYRQQKLTASHHWQDGWLTVDQSLGLMNLEQQTAGYIEGQDAYRNRQLRQENLDPQAWRNADSLRYHSRFRYRNTDVEWTVTPYLRSNRMDFLMHFVPWQPVEENWHDSIGWQGQWRRLLANGSDLTLGHEFEFTRGGLAEIQSDPAPFQQAQFPVGEHYRYQVDALSTAIFAASYMQLTPVFALDLAVRMDFDHYAYSNQLADGWACAEGVNGCRFYRPASQENHFTEPSAHAGFVYHWLNQAWLFGKWSTGFRMPQTSELYRAQSEVIDLIEPERISGLELGVRGGGDRLRAQVAVYAMASRSSIYQDTQRRYVNGGATRHTGIEYELEGQVGEHWLWQLSGQYARHTYRNSPAILGLAENMDLRGNLMDTAPRHTHYAAVTWRPSVDWQLALQWHLMGRYFMDPENTVAYPGHRLLDVAIRRQYGENWLVTATLNNVLDADYADRADVAFGEPRYFPGRERTLSVGLQYRFD